MYQCHPAKTGDFRPSSNKNCGIRTIEFGPHTQRLPEAKSICKAADLRDYDVACLHQRHCPRSIMATKVLFTRRPFPAFPSNADKRFSLNVKLIQKWVLNDYLISMWLIWLRISTPKILFPAILYCSEALYHQVCSTERTFLRISSHIAITLTKKIWTWRIQANVNYRWEIHCLLIVRIEPKC